MDTQNQQQLPCVVAPDGKLAYQAVGGGVFCHPQLMDLIEQKTHKNIALDRVWIRSFL
jgi:hypothetical protein